jgi:hypothetical protein
LQAFVFVDPASGNLTERSGVEMVKFLTALPGGGDETGLFELEQMFGHGLTGHGEIGAQRSQSLPILDMQPIK